MTWEQKNKFTSTSLLMVMLLMMMMLLLQFQPVVGYRLRGNNNNYENSKRGRRMSNYQDGYFENHVYYSREGTLQYDDDTFYIRHYSHTDNSVKGCKKSGKTGYGATCEPSTSPSEAPTSIPTSSPSKQPSLSPSAARSVSPTISNAPSAAPSDSPSVSPTNQPTATPSVGPTRSSRPSVAPTDLPTTKPSPAPSPSPSRSPSASPSPGPSPSPTNMPSVSPTNSAMPSNRPTGSPSASPSTAPSGSPTASPSAQPSSSPTVSSAPTQIRFQTTIGDDALSSECLDTFDGSGTTQFQSLAFNYNLYLNASANVDDARSTMERSLHFGMVRQFLDCDFESDATFHIFSISSSPEDQVSDDACDTTSDPSLEVESKCVVVNAEMTLEVFLPSSRLRRMQETDANPEVLEEFAVYLEESMSSGDFVDGDILQVSFQGFQDPTSSDGSAVGIIGGNFAQPADQDSKVLGSVVVGLAGLCFVAVAVLSIQKGRRKAHLRHVALGDELSEISDDSFLEKRDRKKDKFRIFMHDDDGKVQIVMHDDDRSYHEDDSYKVVEVDRETADTSLEHAAKTPRERDGHRCASETCEFCQCASATCEFCQSRVLQPIFVCTDLGQSLLSDLCAKPTPKEPRPTYLAPDTVEL